MVATVDVELAPVESVAEPELPDVLLELEDGFEVDMYVAQVGGYACLYAAMLLTFASIIFRRRDFL